MEKKERINSKYFELSYKYALYKTGSIVNAKEIATKALILYLEKKDTIIDKNIEGWIINTTKNYVRKSFRKSNKFKLNEHKLEEYSISKSYLQEKDISLHEAFKDSLNTLNEEELQILHSYNQCSQCLIKMHRSVGGSYCALRKRISRIKKKIKAETYKRLGVIATKNILTPQLENLINNFLGSFKTNLNNNTLEKMHYYFSEVNIKNYNPSFNIKKIINFCIQNSNNIYKIWVIYKNYESLVDSFFFEFDIDKKKYLKIKLLPQKSEKKIIIDSDSREGKRLIQLLKKSKKNRNGLLQFPEEAIQIIIDSAKPSSG